MTVAYLFTMQAIIHQNQMRKRHNLRELEVQIWL